MPAGEFSFQAFQERVDAAFPDLGQTPHSAERYSLWAVLAGIVIGILGAVIGVNNLVGQVTALSGLFIEVVGGAVYVWFGSVRVFREIRFDGKSGAHELEQSFGGYQSVVSWLREFPIDQLQTRLTFATNRADAWQHGTLLVMGSLDRLGILPVVVAVYFQFKDAKLSWPPDISLAGGMLAVVIVSIYVVGLWAMTRRLQVTVFVRLLKVALDEDFKITAPEPQGASDRAGSSGGEPGANATD